MDKDVTFTSVKPSQRLADFVESFWMLCNLSASDKEIIILPDGRADLTFFESSSSPFRIIRSGLETYPQPATLKSGTRMFAVSFKLLAIEYIFHDSIARLLNYAEQLPANFWNFEASDLFDFDHFCEKATAAVESKLPHEVDARKQKLFELLYQTKGDMSVKEIAGQAFWSSRQINRYFNEHFGISLKTYCSILRFRASFPHIKAGKLFPQQDFADQSHFIKEVKKLSGVSPKELQRNKDDRFIQFSALDP